MTPLMVVALFWVAVVVAVATTVVVMAALNAWGDPQPVRSLLADVGFLSEPGEYEGAHRQGWSR
jgi:hypothetical protein